MKKKVNFKKIFKLITLNLLTSSNKNVLVNIELI
jgi:hypothetical protein